MIEIPIMPVDLKFGKVDKSLILIKPTFTKMSGKLQISQFGGIFSDLETANHKLYNDIQQA